MFQYFSKKEICNTFPESQGEPKSRSKKSKVRRSKMAARLDGSCSSVEASVSVTSASADSVKVKREHVQRSHEVPLPTARHHHRRSVSRERRSASRDREDCPTTNGIITKSVRHRSSSGERNSSSQERKWQGDQTPDGHASSGKAESLQKSKEKVRSGKTARKSIESRDAARQSQDQTGKHRFVLDLATQISP